MVVKLFLSAISKYMNISNINIGITNLNFTSGLTKRVLWKEKCVSSADIEEKLLNKGIQAEFAGNKAIALINEICARIAVDIEKTYNLSQFGHFFPPFVKVFEHNQLIDGLDENSFCIKDTQEVLKNELPYPGCSIFFVRKNNLQEIDDECEKKFKNKISSSSHFLSPFIHEWIHCFQLQNIYSKYGYGGTCDYMNSLYPANDKTHCGYNIIKNYENKNLSSEENAIIFDELGEYATYPQNQYFEVFSEAFTKYICLSLSKDFKLIKNPIELIKQTSLAFQKVLCKVINLQ